MEMPLINHRPAARGTLLDLFGKNGCKRENCASVSQQW
jgi:hypothetical protein